MACVTNVNATVSSKQVLGVGEHIDIPSLCPIAFCENPEEREMVVFKYSKRSSLETGPFHLVVAVRAPNPDQLYDLPPWVPPATHHHAELTCPFEEQVNHG